MNGCIGVSIPEYWKQSMRNFAIGVIIGVLVLATARFAFVPHEHEVHHHANFAVFIDGRRLDLTDDRYMELVSACGATGQGVLPRERVHMHENNHDVVHVHHDGVSWGHFFTNLGFAIGEDFLILDDGRRLFADGERSFKFIVNGMPVPAVHDRLIRPGGERVLISYGAESVDEVIAAQFPVVAMDAVEFDATYDPAGCSGGHEESFGERLRRAFWN